MGRCRVWFVGLFVQGLRLLNIFVLLFLFTLFIHKVLMNDVNGKRRSKTGKSKRFAKQIFYGFGWRASPDCESSRECVGSIFREAEMRRGGVGFWFVLWLSLRPSKLWTGLLWQADRTSGPRLIPISEKWLLVQFAIARQAKPGSMIAWTRNPQKYL